MANPRNAKMSCRWCDFEPSVWIRIFRLAKSRGWSEHDDSWYCPYHDPARNEEIRDKITLNRACRSGNLQTVRELIARKPHLLNGQAFRETPLVAAAKGGQPNIVTFLLESGGNPEEQVGYPPATALQEAEFMLLLSDQPAVQKPYVEIVEILTSDVALRNDLNCLRAYGAHRAQQWWRKSGKEEAICDYCNAEVPAASGYLIGAMLICVRCGDKAYSEKQQLEGLRSNPDFFGDGSLQAAREYASRQKR